MKSLVMHGICITPAMTFPHANTAEFWIRIRTNSKNKLSSFEFTAMLLSGIAAVTQVVNACMRIAMIDLIYSHRCPAAPMDSELSINRTEIPLRTCGRPEGITIVTTFLLYFTCMCMHGTYTPMCMWDIYIGYRVVNVCPACMHMAGYWL